jgi:UDP-N-acetylglucosamine 2-epimerase (non-hydrolysing)
MSKKVMLVCGARPNFMKVAMILKEMRSFPDVFAPVLVHTGQHYDWGMSGAFFADLGLQKPDIYLGVGSGNHGEQTGRIMIALEEAVIDNRPDLIIVVGDVNSTAAAAMVASKLWIPLAHVEAGLRSFDRTMPEEVNRVVTDVLSDFLFTTEEDADANLVREGIAPGKIHLVGDVMVDCMFLYREKATQSDVLNRLGLVPREYILLTLHRPSNVDLKDILADIMDAIEIVASRSPVVFPAHPRTQKRANEFGVSLSRPGLIVTEPLGYLEFLCLEERAQLVLTDSGSVQIETTAFGIPCLTLRENTERPFSVRKGTNTLVGYDKDRVVKESFARLDGEGKGGESHPLWDGKASRRIVEILKRKL